jgi:hypothetical protein
MALKDLKMSKQGTVVKRNHVTLMIPQEVEINKKLEIGKNRSMVVVHITLDCQRL